MTSGEAGPPGHAPTSWRLERRQGSGDAFWASRGLVSPPSAQRAALGRRQGVSLSPWFLSGGGVPLRNEAMPWSHLVMSTSLPCTQPFPS